MFKSGMFVYGQGQEADSLLTLTFNFKVNGSLENSTFEPCFILWPSRWIKLYRSISINWQIIDIESLLLRSNRVH